MSNKTILSGLLSRIYIENKRPFTLATFDDRLRYQKTVYLLQSFGIRLGYGYSWYLRGPYSISAMDDGYELFRRYTMQGKKLPDDIVFTPESEVRFKDFIGLMNTTKMDPLCLELLASIVFIKKAYECKDNDSIYYILTRSKKVERTKFNEAVKLLKKYSL